MSGTLQLLVQGLSFGAIGLGLGLAYFAYRLLQQEQRRDSVRAPMLKAIDRFKWFSGALTALGVALEIIRVLVGQPTPPTPPCPPCEVSGKALDDLFRTGTELGLARAQAQQQGASGPIGNVTGAHLRATASGLLPATTLRRFSELSGEPRPTDAQLTTLQELVSADLNARK